MQVEMRDPALFAQAFAAGQPMTLEEAFATLLSARLPFPLDGVLFPDQRLGEEQKTLAGN